MLQKDAQLVQMASNCVWDPVALRLRLSLNEQLVK